MWTGHGSWVGPVLRVGAVTQRRTSVVTFILAPGAPTCRNIRRGEHTKGGRRRTVGRLGFWGKRRSLGAGVKYLWGWRSGRLVTSIVDNARQQLLSSTGHLLHGLFGGVIFARSVRGMGHATRQTRGRHRRQVVGLGGVGARCIQVDISEARIPVATQCIGTEDVGEGRKTIVCLGCRHLMHVGGRAQGRALVDNMAGQWLWLVPASESLV